MAVVVEPDGMTQPLHSRAITATPLLLRAAPDLSGVLVFALVDVVTCSFPLTSNGRFPRSEQRPAMG